MTKVDSIRKNQKSVFSNFLIIRSWLSNILVVEVQAISKTLIFLAKCIKIIKLLTFIAKTC